jgi:hypothetical protein
MDPRELELIQKQRGQAAFVHSIAQQLGEARGPVAPVAPPPPASGSAPLPAPLGVPLWAWAGLAVAAVAVVVVTRKRG